MDSARGRPSGAATGGAAGGAAVPGLAPDTLRAAAARLSHLNGQLAALAAKADYVQLEQAHREIAALAAVVYGPDSPQAVQTRMKHAQILRSLHPESPTDETKAIFERCRTVLGDEHEMTFRTRDAYVASIAYTDTFPAALGPAESAFDDAREVFGRRSPVALRAQCRYARALASAGHFRESLALTGEVRAALDSFVTADKGLEESCEQNRQTALVLAGRYGEALESVTRTAEKTAKAYGTAHPQLHLHRLTHAQILEQLGDPHTAAAEARQAADVLARHFGPDHTNTLVAYYVEGRALTTMGRTAEAVDATRYAYEHLMWRWGRPNSYAVTGGANLARALLADARPAEALGLSRILADQALHVCGPAHGTTLTIRLRAAQALAATGESERGREELAAALADHVSVLGDDHPLTERCRQAQLAA